MERIPILRMGDTLLVTIQVDMQDRTALALQEDLAARIADTGATGVMIDISGLEIVDSFVGHGADAKALGAAFDTRLADALKAAGYPQKADPAQLNWPMTIVILTILVIFVTMVYGPIAAMLVEMFPTRIRYTSMSLPYHIGNGWFGGFLPATAFAIVAAKGDIYSGLWYPIVIALVTFVIGLLFVKETKDSNIYAQD